MAREPAGRDGPSRDGGFAMGAGDPAAVRQPSPAAKAGRADASPPVTGNALAGAVAVVTGAAGGIGRAVARRLAEEGAWVVLTGRDEEALSGVDLGPGIAPAAVHLLDVRDAAAWERVAAAVLEAFGRIDVLVSNAGIVDPGPHESLSPERLQALVDTNLLGAMLGARAVLPPMKARGGGAIVHVASLGGLVPMPFEASYAATKAAVRQFALSLRVEVAASGVRVSVVSPDSVDTPQLLQELAFDEASLSFASPPLPPEAVARAVVKAIRSGAPEVLVPAAGGLAARMAAAFPRLLLWAVPWLRRAGSRRMRRLRAPSAPR
jgi:NADP-dependent 3-hydroxy acid dehydrogenase YdfG